MEFEFDLSCFNNNDNDTSTGNTNEFISFKLQSLETRGERQKS